MESGALDLGRKIFFLNAPTKFQDTIIPMLATSGYELYVLSSYKYAKSILREYPSAVFFICIDSELLIDEWYNFVSSISNDKNFQNVILGIMSTYAGQKEKDHFLLNASIPGGFVSLSQSDEIIHDYIHSILNINEAKGRRNFVRANCEEEKDLAGEYEVKGFHHSLKISNISSAGILCETFPVAQALFTNKKLLNNFIINIKGQKTKANVTIYRTYIENEKLFLVLLFTEDLSFSAKSAIDIYVRNLLQSRIDARIKNMPLDSENYSKRQKSAIAGDSDEAFLIAESSEGN